MKNHHKRFVNIRYKNKLIVKSYENRWFTDIVFYTDEPDTSDARTLPNHTYWHYDSCRKKYRYHHKPDVPYAVIESRNYRVKAKRYYKRIANRKVRRYKQDIASGGAYKKVFDYRWAID